MAGTGSSGIVESAAGSLQTSNQNPAVSAGQPATQTSTTMPSIGGFPAPQPAPESPHAGVVAAAFAGQGTRGGPLPVPKRFVPYYDVLRKRRESWSNFPCGLRVLVADNDPASLQVVEKMLKKCDYQVTLCSSGKNSLEILRKRREEFDIVLAEATLPDIDGFKILDVCSKELSLPVVLMSCTGETSAVMRGVMEGARDFLIKPLRQEELKTLWQHVVRYTNELTKSEGAPGGGSTKGESVFLGKTPYPDTPQKSNKSTGDSDKDSDSSSSKKQRVIWSAEMHQQFVVAVNQLGIDKAVPKRILDLMNITGLTRENVASHLQKYRLYLKRMANSQDGSVPPGLSAMEGLVSSESFPGIVSNAPAGSQSSSQGVAGQQQYHYIQQQAPGSQMTSGSPQVLPAGMQMSSGMMQGQLAVGPHHMIQMSNGMLVMPQQMQQAGMMSQDMMQAQASGMTMMSYPMMQVQQQQTRTDGVVKSQPLQHHQIGPYQVSQDGSMLQMTMGDMQQMSTSQDQQLVYAHNGQQQQQWQSGWQQNDM